MEESAREGASDSSRVTTDMLGVAEKLLVEMRVGKMSKHYSNRDVLYEIISAILFITGGPVEAETKVIDLTVATTSGSLAKTEDEWSQFFKSCKVVVKDSHIGMKLLQEGLNSSEAFTELIGAIAQNKAIVVSLEDYPGISLFKEQTTQRKGKAE